MKKDGGWERLLNCKLTEAGDPGIYIMISATNSSIQEIFMKELNNWIEEAAGTFPEITDEDRSRGRPSKDRNLAKGKDIRKKNTGERNKN